MEIDQPDCHRRACVAVRIRCGTMSAERLHRGLVREDLMREDRSPQLSVPIDAELKARLEAAAAREDRPVASFVRLIVLKALDGEREGAAA